MKLTKKSKDLMLFFEKYNTINHEKHTKNINDMLTQLYDDICKADYYIKNYIDYFPTIKHIKTASQITKPVYFNSKSFPDTIHRHIDEYSIIELCYSFSLYERNVKVYFILEKSVNIKTYNEYVDTIAMWLHILTSYASKKCAKTINIYLYMTSLEKRLPNSNSYILNEINVNTAFTSTCPVDSEIVIFRKEEWFKVLIHETFHNFELDFSGINNDIINKCIRNIYSVNSQLNVYEAYTEFWAEIINTLFCSYNMLKNKRDLSQFLMYSNLYINLEKQHSIFQLVKTLDFMGIQYDDLYLKTKESAHHREKFYKENTNVLAYYIIKAVLMNNYQLFLIWCNEHNNNILDFKKTNKNLLLFCQFIKEHYNSKQLLANIKNTKLFLSKIKKDNPKNSFILLTMRMSICELD